MNMEYSVSFTQNGKNKTVNVCNLMGALVALIESARLGMTIEHVTIHGVKNK